MKEETKVFLLFYKSIKQGEYFIKRVARVPPEYQNLSSGKNRVPSPFFLVSSVLAIKVLIPQASEVIQSPGLGVSAALLPHQCRTIAGPGV